MHLPFGLKSKFQFGLKVALSLFVFFLLLDILAILFAPLVAIKIAVLSPLDGLKMLTGIDLAAIVNNANPLKKSA